MLKTLIITNLRAVCLSPAEVAHSGVVCLSDSKIELQTATHSLQMYAWMGPREGLAISFSISSLLLLQNEHFRVCFFLRSLNRLNTGRSSQ
jgi:hypothetical protein